MPIYEYQCLDCQNQFEVWVRTFEVKSEICPKCQSQNIKRLLSTPLIRTEKYKEPTTEFGRKEEAIDYYKKKGRFDFAAKEAEKVGKSEWEVKRIREGKR